MVITIILFLSAKPSFSFNHIHTSYPSLIPSLLSFHLLILLLNIINRIQSTIPCVIALFPIALSVIVIIHPLPETVIICPSAYIPLMLPNKPSGAHYLHHPSHHSLQSYNARNWNYYWVTAFSIHGYDECNYKCTQSLSILHRCNWFLLHW